jgi:hypothetical protein
VKPREKSSPTAMAAPPPELRMFADPSKVDGRGPGMDAFPDRAAWLAARAEWAAGHGKTVGQWFDDLMEEVRQDMHSGHCTLAESSDMFRFYVEPDDWHDPRLNGPE